tara:strand:+ start:1857 stop:2483 length:627 start_codon:yes stop_codon:yes gene_type:complete
MLARILGKHSLISDRGLIDRAILLLSQEIWCWGRDILRPEGNWLQEIGFHRIEPPEGHDECSSVYSLDLPGDRVVVLRGFGVFYGDIRLGGVFLHRYEFLPQYTKLAKLDAQPWLHADLPDMNPPTERQRASCAALMLDLIDWIRSYEVNIAELLGVGYRRSTLVKWDNGERPIIRAEDMPSEWCLLGIAMAADFRSVLPDGDADRGQ